MGEKDWNKTFDGEVPQNELDELALNAAFEQMLLLEDELIKQLEGEISEIELREKYEEGIADQEVWKRTFQVITLSKESRLAKAFHGEATTITSIEELREKYPEASFTDITVSSTDTKQFADRYEALYLKLLELSAGERISAEYDDDILLAKCTDVIVGEPVPFEDLKNSLLNHCARERLASLLDNAKKTAILHEQ